MEGTQQTSHYFCKPVDYKEALTRGEDVYLQFSLLTPEVEACLIRVLSIYLSQLDLLYLKDMFINILKELVNNAIKANAKRLYFKRKNLDINKKEEYRNGMETFKEDVFVGNPEFLEELGKSNFIVRVFFSITGDIHKIHVINNVPIIPEEMNKINARIKKAYTYHGISDAFDDILDDSEGAGLGLIITLILMKNAGFPPEAFSMSTNGKITSATINIDESFRNMDLKVKMAQEIINEVESLPSFPQNILEIQRLCANPESTIKAIADSIKRDPGLVTAILKLANSAGYITSKRVETIEEAVKIIGTKGINTLLVASGVQKIIDSRYKKFETIWNNSYKTAFYAQWIAMKYRKERLSEFAYLASLLSDIGLMVLLSIKPDEIQKIREIVGLKQLDNISILEEISLGVSHSTLGSLICQKWKFNDALVKAIEFHHRPHLAPSQYRDLIYIVYLAYVFTSIESKNFRFEIADEDCLDYFKLNNKINFDELHQLIKAKFEEYSQNNKITN